MGRCAFGATMTRFVGGVDVMAGEMTNASSLTIGDKLTQGQIDALGEIEHLLIEWLWRVDDESTRAMEKVCHAFMCNAMGDCVCKIQRELEA